MQRESAYRRRDPEHTVLYRVVAREYLGFAAAVRAQNEYGRDLPRHVDDACAPDPLLRHLCSAGAPAPGAHRTEASTAHEVRTARGGHLTAVPAPTAAGPCRAASGDGTHRVGPWRSTADGRSRRAPVVGRPAPPGPQGGPHDVLG